MNGDEKDITVGWDEAINISAILKLHARQCQQAADIFRKNGELGRASHFDNSAAQVDAFADKLVAPFLGADGVEAMNANIDT